MKRISPFFRFSSRFSFSTAAVVAAVAFTFGAMIGCAEREGFPLDPGGELSSSGNLSSSVDLSSSSLSSGISSPSSSSVPGNSSSVRPSSSSAKSSSSSAAADPGCTREKVESSEFPEGIYFKFEPGKLYSDGGMPALNGWTGGGSFYIRDNYGADTWVVPTGADCDQRVKIVDFPDSYNAIIDEVWQGDLIDSTEVDVVAPIPPDVWE